MSLWHMNDPQNLSLAAQGDPEGTLREYPERLKHTNSDIVRMLHVAPGIVEVESRHGDDRVLVLSGGMHGDEKAGVVILDRLVHNLINGTIPVQRNLLLLYGNLRAMNERGGQGVRCIEPEVGLTANLNRCFGRGLFASPICYAERRANQMMQSARVLRGCTVEAIDIHQSFRVPVLNDVRKHGDRTEYTYAMLYPHTVNDAIDWIYQFYSDIVAGAVLNDMNIVHRTWAGYMAQEYKAHAATFEQGTIGHLDYVTFTPQLYENLRRSIAGRGRLSEPEGFDVWQCVRSIVRTTEGFSFLDEDGNSLPGAPLDFVPLGDAVVARDGEILHSITSGERLLFANADVPIGDRTAQVIVRYETDRIPRP